MNGVSHDTWNRMKLLGEKLEECRREMDAIVADFHVEEDDEDYFGAVAGINDTIGSWWTLCDRYHSGDFVEEKCWENRKDAIFEERRHEEEVRKRYEDGMAKQENA